jgi:FAD/FMN-containing dehydrogenase
MMHEHLSDDDLHCHSGDGHMDAPWRLAGAGAERGEITTPHDDLIAQIWLELGGQISQERICQVATEVETMFRGATVTAFVPILMHREIRERLMQDI